MIGEERITDEKKEKRKRERKREKEKKEKKMEGERIKGSWVLYDEKRK